MNVRLLRKVKKHILAEPKRFAMEWWHGTAKPGRVPLMFDPGHNAPKCGTVACLAGWTCVLSEEKIDAPYFEFPDRARELLDLKPQQSRQLFHTSWWPEKFREPYLMAKTRKRQATIAAERIEYFIATKGAE